MTNRYLFIFLVDFLFVAGAVAQDAVSPEKIRFVRQGVRRFVFDDRQRIPLAALLPREIIGMTSMYPTTHYSKSHANIQVLNEQLAIKADTETESAIWFAGFNPFATYTIDLATSEGQGKIGFEFSDAQKTERLLITIDYSDEAILGVHQTLVKNGDMISSESIGNSNSKESQLRGKVILQMLGSGLTMYIQNAGLPVVIGQSTFNKLIDLRRKSYISSFQSSLYVKLNNGKVLVDKVESALTSGMGLADIRAITYENGEPMLDQGRLWYTMTIRGRDLPQHIQGVFSLNPTVFDLKFEGIIVFDQDDGLLRNEVASHIFFDRRDAMWRGLTTGFSSFANPKEKKELLTVTSKKDPRFGFSVMNTRSFGVVGDFEDPHILYDSTARKWRMLTCVNENKKGYQAVMMESDQWDQGYRRIAHARDHNATGTSIQRIGNKRYCFSGSSERAVFIYTYPELREVGTLKMDLPPWDATSGTRVWPNVVQLPEGYPFRYVALMMDRYKYPGIEGNHWSYGAVYLYAGYVE